MVNSNNITDTSSRLLSNLNNLSKKVYDEQNVEEQITDAVENSMITTGNVIKYYPSLNKSKVTLDNSDKTVLCKNISIIGGDMLCLFTPVGDRSFCEDLKEPCIVPRGKLSAIITPLRDSDEWLLLGYFNRSDLVGFNPSKRGNLKLLAFGSLGQYSVKFGIDGLKIYNNGKIEKSEVNVYGEDVSDKFYTVEEVNDNITNTTTLLENKIDDTKEETISFLFDKIYPVGSIYMSVNPTSPSVLFGGQWVKLTDTFLYASATDIEQSSVTATDGEATHELTVNEMPSHTHSNTDGSIYFLGYNTTNPNTSSGFQAGNLWNNVAKSKTTIANTGGDANGNTVAHNNMPPYMAVNMWKRVE